ncbi:hypothetical protein ACLOJK_022725 [Asimina triloba]
MDQTVADQRPQTIKQLIENQALAKIMFDVQQRHKWATLQAFEIDRNGEGALFIEAEANVARDYFRDFTPIPNPSSNSAPTRQQGEHAQIPVAS